ncbi:MAG: GntR family transcriptional regulator [Rhodospirillales bacterium]|nr:GntR family transcriptional regulator [Rhodospirillales bacterium]
MYDVLREEILWVRIAPGSALDERALAARFEVSRTPIREALLLLAGERLVEFLPNRTSIVAHFSLDNTGDYLDTALIISRAMARAAALSGRAEAAVLNEHVERFVQAVEADDWETSLRSELEALRHLAGLSGNIFLIKYFDQVIDAGMRMRVLHYYPNASAEERRASADRLEALVEAVLAGDAAAGDRAIERMILADSAIIVRSLEPGFGAEMRLERVGQGLGAL